MKNLFRIICGKKPIYRVPYWKHIPTGSMIWTESMQYKWLNLGYKRGHVLLDREI